MFVFVAAVVVDIIVVLCAGSERTDLRWDGGSLLIRLFVIMTMLTKKEDKN